MKIEGLGALVTGGASGLGEATARLLADRGAEVALLDLPRSKGSDVAKEIGGNTLFLPADVTSEEQVAAAIDRASESFGALHILVNCAGIGSASRNGWRFHRLSRLSCCGGLVRGRGVSTDAPR